MIIIGESALELKSGKYIIEEFKKFLKENNLMIRRLECFKFFTTKCLYSWLNRSKNFS